MTTIHRPSRFRELHIVQGYLKVDVTHLSVSSLVRFIACVWVRNGFLILGASFRSALLAPRYVSLSKHVPLDR